jgi:uncharacterized protein YvpB
MAGKPCRMQTVITARATAWGLLAVLALVGCTASGRTARPAAEAPAAEISQTGGSGSTNPMANRPHVSAPRQLEGSATSPSVVHLSWMPSNSVIVGYYLTATPGSVAVDLAAGATSADVSGLAVYTTYTFSLQAVGEEQLSLPASVVVKTPLPTSNVIQSVPQYYQLPLSCEETATSMALVNQGLDISTKQILAGLGVDNTPLVIRGGRIVSWGNPDKAFVGNVYGSENHAPWGYQSNPKALVRVLDSLGAKVIEWSEPGVTTNTISASEIYTQVLLGHPVVAYATWDWQHHEVYNYTSEDGNSVATIYPWDDHVYTVVGVNASQALVHDPIRGTYWVDRGAFEAAYEFGMAIVLQ